MDFDVCVELLAARPADAHAHCEHATMGEETQQQPSVGAESSVASATDGDAADNRSARALVRAFFQLQEQRVQIYADFHKGFDAHKKTPGFQEFSVGITQRFARVSEQINRVERSLKEDRQQPAIAQLVRKVQMEEKEKLLLTSAVLVEKMRMHDAASAAEPDESAVAFLERSVATLNDKHAACIDRINELLDEVRIEAADLDEEDEDDA